jgi:Ser/Thr protein kinase RdoA (MazF antagonist)
MRQLTGELSELRKEVELPCAPIHGDYKLGNAGEGSDGSWATFDLDFARVRERVYDVAASLHHVAHSGELLEPRRLLDAYEGTAPEPLTPDEHRWLPGAHSGTLAQPSVGTPGGVYSGFAQIGSYAFAPLRAVRTRGGPVSSTGVTC